MNPVNGTSTVTLNPPPPLGSTSATTNESLMPSPTADNIDDAMTTVLVLLSKQQTNDLVNGEAGVQLDKGQRDKAAADEKAAREKAEANSASHGTGFFGSIEGLVKDVSRDAVHGRFDKIAGDTVHDVKAAANSPRFWADLEKGAQKVATVAAAAAGLAATIVTAGTAAPAVVAAAIALSAGGFAVSQTNCFGKASAYVDLGIQIGAAALTFGGSSVNAASGGVKLVAKLGIGAGIAAGSADVVAGTAHIENKKYEARAEDAQADETAATDQVAKETRLSQWLLDNLSAGQQAEKDTTSTLQGIIQQHDAGKVPLASTRG